MREYFPEPKSSGGRVKVELDLSNYATKADLKNTTGFATENKYKYFYDLEMIFSVTFRFILEAFSNYSELLLSNFS